MDIRIENFKGVETDRGFAYWADIHLGEKKIGSIENPGDGSYTRVSLISEQDTFNQMMREHFDRLGWNYKDEEEYALLYTFAEHLLDLHEHGQVSRAYMELGFMR